MVTSQEAHWDPAESILINIKKTAHLSVSSWGFQSSVPGIRDKVPILTAQSVVVSFLSGPAPLPPMKLRRQDCAWVCSLLYLSSQQCAPNIHV